ncbi:hypothetical protein NERG_01026 [Nematocida ausubeli]|uniref:Uncharacterized protein n=1 Tax=Nematocida ausubeli (strain ATCC PRA-371 / ERTm2) TaxID=1913371 RepID=H8ZBS7_NEMA1|nr:hypothetical protein NERG_01026 [Nematocida ausubeli]
MKWSSFLRFLGISSGVGETYPDANYVGTLDKKEVTIYNTSQPTYRLVYDHHVQGIRFLNLQAIKKNKKHINAIMVLSKTSGTDRYKILIKPGDRRASLSDKTQKLLCVVKSDYKVTACKADSSSSSYTMEWKITPFVNGYKIQDVDTESCLVRETDNGILSIVSCSKSTPEHRFDMLEVADDPYKHLYLSGSQLLAYEMQGSGGAGGSLPDWMMNGLAGGGTHESPNNDGSGGGNGGWNSPYHHDGYGQNGNPNDPSSMQPYYGYNRHPWNGPFGPPHGLSGPNNQYWPSNNGCAPGGNNGGYNPNGNGGYGPGSNGGYRPGGHNGGYSPNGHNGGYGPGGNGGYGPGGNNGGYNPNGNGGYGPGGSGGYNPNGNGGYGPDGNNGGYNPNGNGGYGGYNPNGNGGYGPGGHNGGYGPGGNGGHNNGYGNGNNNGYGPGNGGGYGPGGHNGGYNPNGNGMAGMFNRRSAVIDLHDLGNNIGMLKNIVKTLKTFCNESFSDLGVCSPSNNISNMDPEQLRNLIKQHMPQTNSIDYTHSDRNHPRMQDRDSAHHYKDIQYRDGQPDYHRPHERLPRGAHHAGHPIYPADERDPPHYRHTHHTSPRPRGPYMSGHYQGDDYEENIIREKRSADGRRRPSLKRDRNGKTLECYPLDDLDGRPARDHRHISDNFEGRKHYRDDDFEDMYDERHHTRRAHAVPTYKHHRPQYY